MRPFFVVVDPQSFNDSPRFVERLEEVFIQTFVSEPTVRNFPPECAHILGVLAAVYKNDAIAKKRKMTSTERLKFHQNKSGPAMKKLHAWMQAQITEKKVEPNSGLGDALGYMLKHWEKLTLFLRRAGPDRQRKLTQSC